MPLNEGAINEILPFAAEALEGAGDVLSLEEYKNHPMRLRGHMVGLALRELQNREARQATHFAAGSAQFLANRYAPGVRDDGNLDKIEAAWLEVISKLIATAMLEIPTAPDKYDLCEFYYFRHPTLKPGFQPAQGGLIANAATLYPSAWTYLQTTQGQLLCKTEAAWQALTTATWATLADGTKTGWNGIGGAPFYAPNTSTGALRLPDLRGMYAEAAGFDSLGVGGVHGDRFQGHMHEVLDSSALTAYVGTSSSGSGSTVRSGSLTTPLRFQAKSIIDDGVNGPPSVGSTTRPRAWGALVCVYLGAPK